MRKIYMQLLAIVSMHKSTYRILIHSAHNAVGMIVISCMFTLGRHVCVLENNHND